MGFGMVIGFITLLKIVATNNYSAIANWHTLQFTIACTKSCKTSLGVAWQRIPTMSSASLLTSLPAGCHLTTGPQLAAHWLWLSDGRSVKLLLAFTNTVILDFRPLRDSWPYFYFQDVYVFWNGASSSTRGGVWLILVTPPLLGVIRAVTHSLTHSLTESIRSTPLVFSRHVTVLRWWNSFKCTIIHRLSMFIRLCWVFLSLL
jgi:hypothetical protein